MNATGVKLGFYFQAFCSIFHRWVDGVGFLLRIDTSFENFSHNGQHTLAITLTDGRRLACFLFCFRWPRALFEKCSYILIHDATVLLGFGAASIYFDLRPTDWLCMSGTWMLPFSFLFFTSQILFFIFFTSRLSRGVSLYFFFDISSLSIVHLCSSWLA